jgi:1,2-phenylacetyl-CoA epoxidase PaaB subunit
MITFKKYLIETITINRNVYKDIYDDFINMAKVVRSKGLQKISYKTFPAKRFKIDLTGTTWEHLNALNPTIVVYYTMQRNESYMQNIDPVNKNNRENITNGVGYIVFDLKSPLYTIISIVEHEVSHFLQELEKVYRKGERIKKSLSTKGVKIGGLPSKRYVPTDITEHGQTLINYYDAFIKNEDNIYVRRAINIPAKDEKQALRTARVKLKREDHYGEYTDKYDTIIVKPSTTTASYATSHRVAHTNRPIEYYTDLTTLLRLLQFNYHNNPELKMSKSDYLNTFLKGQYDKLGKFYLLNLCTGVVEKLKNNTGNKQVTRYQVYDKGNNKVMKVVAKDEEGALKKAKKALGAKFSPDMTVREAQNISFYSYMIGKLANKFLNEDYKDVYQDVKKSIMEINASQKSPEELAKEKEKKNTLQAQNLPEGMKVFNFKGPVQIVSIDDWLVGFPDENAEHGKSHTEETESFLQSLGLKERENRNGNYVFNIPRNSKIIDRLFRKCRKYIDIYKDDKSEEGVFEYVKYVTGARELFNTINKSFRNADNRIPESVFEAWIGMPLVDPEFPNF